MHACAAARMDFYVCTWIKLCDTSCYVYINIIRYVFLILEKEKSLIFLSIQRKLTLKVLFDIVGKKVAQQISKKRNKNLNTNQEQIVEN